MNEFDIIEKYFMPLAAKAGKESLNLRDDCAIITSNNQIVINVDSIIEGEHFFTADPPSSIAHKLLHVNLSDIAAMGASPKYWTLAISIPKNRFINEKWLKEFCYTLENIQNQHNFYLISGDTTFSASNLILTANIFAEIPKLQAPLKKSTAQVGDAICVSGYIGDGYWGLQMRRDDIKNQNNFHISIDDKSYLINRYLYPQARLELGQMLITAANSATDISDGLWADLEKLCKYSGVLGVINAGYVPLSAAVQNISDRDKIIKSITGGDDYELAFTINESKLADLKKQLTVNNITIPITKIGYVEKAAEQDYIKFFHNDVLLQTSHKGYNY
ncbi:MAG: thiamine-phosphate kinase [Alphaproteobacteria bacterium]|nr:thiamine-phosphate kinase [Alphaproteobacteria bacterium]